MFRQVLLVAVLAALALTGDAAAKSFALPAADVVVRVAPDGSLVIDEVITFAFDGDFSGAFREIPLRDGESIDQIAVSENDVQYRPGASAELGSTGEPGTFGTTETDKGVRIVWHYRARSEQRSFRIHYRLRGVAVAYDDVVDVNVKVWGDEWEVALQQLSATTVGPAEVLRAWGHPVAVRGDVTLDGRRANLRAVDIPAGQFVELRTLFPDGCSPRPRGCGSSPDRGSSGSWPRSSTTRPRTSATGERSTTRSTICRGRSRCCSPSRSDRPSW